VFGLHAVRHLLTSQRDQAGELVACLKVQQGREDQRLRDLVGLAEGAGVSVQWVPRGELDRLVSGRHQGVVATFAERAGLDERDLPAFLEALDEPALLLVLDGVQDPHNLGACLRSANAGGVHAVLVPKDRAAGLTPTVRKVASGAAESTPLVTVTNLARALRALSDAGLTLIGTDDAAESLLFGADMTGPCALVMGGEARGLRRLTREACDELVRLPMKGVVESLNVGTAAGICIFEAVRQRGAAPR
jgi:23S rRNA (guanosine2251-2'-O)-methyltransferase